MDKKNFNCKEDTNMNSRNKVFRKNKSLQELLLTHNYVIHFICFGKGRLELHSAEQWSIKKLMFEPLHTFNGLNVLIFRCLTSDKSMLLYTKLCQFIVQESEFYVTLPQLNR